jgi:GR25 family glycosyltransferase involved in LPS biosynthesis
MKVWRKMLLEKWTSTLILEADAAWDMNIRASTQKLSYALNDLTERFPRTSWDGPAAEDDPYNINKWDVLSLGQCHEAETHANESVVYSDSDAPEGMAYYQKPLVNERVVRRSGGLICMAAYALSARGAMKLLLRLNLDFDIPVDLVMKEMIEKDELIVYSVQPSIMSQWIYVPGVDGESKNSDIKYWAPVTVQDRKSTWDNVHNSKNIWKLKPHHEDAGLKNGALQAIGGVLYDDKA